MSLKDYLENMDKNTRQAILFLDKKITEAKLECLAVIKPAIPYDDSKLRVKLESIETRHENLRAVVDTAAKKRDRLELMEVRLNQGIRRIEVYEARLNGLEGYLSKFSHAVLVAVQDKLLPENAKGMLKFMRVQESNQERSIAATEEFIATMTKEIQEIEKRLEAKQALLEEKEKELKASNKTIEDFKNDAATDLTKAAALDLLLFLEKHPEAREELGKWWKK